jgi:hypothetical protein
MVFHAGRWYNCKSPPAGMTSSPISRLTRRITISTASTSGRSALVAAMYLIAALLVLSTLLDTAVRIWPLHPGNREWRFGAFGLLLSSPVTPLLGIALAMGAAYVAESARAVRVLSIVSCLAAVLLALLLIAFLIDYAAMASKVQAPLKATFEVATVKAVIMSVLVLPAATLLGLAGMRSLRAGPAAPAEPGRRGGLVVGQSS